MRFFFVISILLTCFDKTILLLSILLLSFHFSFYVDRISGIIATGYFIFASNIKFMLGLVRNIKIDIPNAADLKTCIESTVQTRIKRLLQSIPILLILIDFFFPFGILSLLLVGSVSIYAFSTK